MLNGIKIPVVWTVKVKASRLDRNIVFFCHRRVTLALFEVFILGLLLLHCTDFAEMKCFRSGDCDHVDEPFTSYCWTQGTHTVLRHHELTNLSKVPHPGVGQLLESDEPIYQWSYIWWIPYLVLGYITFRLPWQLWIEYWEGRRLRAIVEELDSILGKKKDEIKKSKEKVLNYFKVNHKLKTYNRSAFRYVFCETLNFLNVLGHMWLLNCLMAGEFTTYGFDVIRYLQGQNEGIDPFARSFPKVTTCHLNIIGPSGSRQLHEGLCVLPLNTLYEKVFFVLWVWYWFLLFLSTIGLIYRICVIYIRKLRYFLLCVLASDCTKKDIANICNRCSYGDWFILYTIRNAVRDDCLFDEWLTLLSKQLTQLDHKTK